MTSHRLILILVLLIAVGQCRVVAQSDVVTAGGGVQTSAGSIDITYGQATCEYAAPDGGRYYVGQGVQQPYCPTVYDTIYDEVCQNGSLTIAGFDVSTSQTREAGVFFFDNHYTTDAGCDSILTLQLTVHPHYMFRDPVVACDSLVTRDTTYRKETNVKFRLLSTFGCDSIGDFSLTIRHSSSSTESQVFSGIIDWRGQTITEPGIYTDTLRGANAEGCDSIVHLVLDGSHMVAPVIYCFSNRLIMVDHYPRGEDEGRVDWAAYRWYRNGQLIEYATRDNYYEYRSNRYQYLSGCFYVEVPAAPGSTAWVASNVLCIDEANAQWPLTLGLYPNPASEGTSVTAEVSEKAQGGQITVYDAYGRVMCSTEVQKLSFALPMRFASGTYTVQVKTADGESISKKLVVK